MRKYIFSFISIMVVLLIHLNIINFIGNLSNYFNPTLVTIIIISLVYGFRLGLLWALVGGFFLDLYSIQNFGIHMISFFLMISFVYYFFRKFITNRTLYSFVILSAVSTLIYFLVCHLISNALYWLDLSQYNYIYNQSLFISFFVHIIVNIFIVSIIYFIVSQMSDRLKSDLIIKENYQK